MEHKIGTKITLEVVERNSCKGCFFLDVIASCKGTQCKYDERKDHKNIIYKEVKDK